MTSQGSEALRLSQRMNDITSSDIRSWTSVIEKRKGINLAQGNCFIETQPEFYRLVEEVRTAMRQGTEQGGYNTYAHASGIDALRHALAQKLREFNGIEADPHLLEGNIVITAGATGAMSCAYDALLDPGDEVIYFEPCYNYHLKSLAFRGGVPRFVKLNPPDWTFDPDEIAALCTDRTRAIVINSPANPIGKIFTREELGQIADICQRFNLVAITDEVYEFIVFDGKTHVSLATLPGMAERTITIGSFSKTMAITGWRVGYAVAPRTIATRIRIANEMNYVCAPTPFQHAIAIVAREWRQFQHLGKLYQAKRDLLADALEVAGFVVHRPSGAYYILSDFSHHGYTDDRIANQSMIEEIGVGGVPGSAFFPSGHGKTMLRFCFAFRNDGLIEAGRRLRNWSETRQGRPTSFSKN